MQYPSPIAGQAEEQGAFEGTEWPSSSSDGPGSDWMLGRSDDIEFTNHLLVGEAYVVALPGNNLIRLSLVERKPLSPYGNLGSRQLLPQPSPPLGWPRRTHAHELAPTEVRCEFLKSSFFIVAVFLWSNRAIIRINMHREATRNPHIVPWGWKGEYFFFLFP